MAWVTTTTRSDFTRVVMSKRYVMGGFWVTLLSGMVVGTRDNRAKFSIVG